MTPPYKNVNPLRVITMVAHEGHRLEPPPESPPVLQNLIRSCFLTPDLRPSFSQVLQTLEQLPQHKLGFKTGFIPGV